MVGNKTLPAGGFFTISSEWRILAPCLVVKSKFHAILIGTSKKQEWICLFHTYRKRTEKSGILICCSKLLRIIRSILQETVGDATSHIDVLCVVLDSLIHRIGSLDVNFTLFGLSGKKKPHSKKKDPEIFSDFNPEKMYFSVKKTTGYARRFIFTMKRSEQITYTPTTDTRMNSTSSPPLPLSGQSRDSSYLPAISAEHEVGCMRHQSIGSASLLMSYSVLVRGDCRQKSLDTVFTLNPTIPQICHHAGIKK